MSPARPGRMQKLWALRPREKRERRWERQGRRREEVWGAAGFRMELCVREGGVDFYQSLWITLLFCFFFFLIVEQTKETFRNLEEENETLKAQFKQCSAQLDSYLSQQSTSQKVIQELNNEVSRQKPRRGEKLEPGSLTWSRHLALLHHRNASNYWAVSILWCSKPHRTLRVPSCSARRMFLPHVEGLIFQKSSGALKLSGLWHQVLQCCIWDQSWLNPLFGAVC